MNDHGRGDGEAAGPDHPLSGLQPGTPAWGTPQPGFPAPIPPPGPSQRDDRRRRYGWSKTAGAAAGTAAIASKVGLITKSLALLKGFAILGKLKVLGSMVLSVMVYALLWGWRFALGFVILLAVHELGHVAALRAQGVEASAPMFIPLVGAFVAVKDRQRSVVDEAWMALAGPAAGLAGSIACLELAELNDSPLLQAIAFSGFLLNLFNLVPMLPLDGGRVAGALHPAIWLGGVVTAAALFVWHPSPVFGFLIVLGGVEAIRRWREYHNGEAGTYYAVPVATRAWIAAAYVSVALICLWGMDTAYMAHPL